MALTDLAILADKNYRIYDSLGSYLEVASGG